MPTSPEVTARINSIDQHISALSSAIHDALGSEKKEISQDFYARSSFQHIRVNLEKLRSIPSEQNRIALQKSIDKWRDVFTDAWSNEDISNDFARRIEHALSEITVDISALKKYLS